MRLLFIITLSLVLLPSFGCRSTPPPEQRGTVVRDPLEYAVDLITLGDDVTKQALRTYYPKTRRRLLLSALAKYNDARKVLLEELRNVYFPYQRENIKRLLRVVEVREETAILYMPLPPRYPF